MWMPFLSAGYEPFPKDDYSHCRTLFLIPYNREPLHILRTFICRGYSYIPIYPLTVFTNRLYIVAVITVLLSLTYRSMQNARTLSGREVWKLLADCLFRRDGYSGGLSDFVYQLCDLGIQFA